MAKYRTAEGDMLDRICWRHYGHTSGMVEKVLKANPGLDEYSEKLPAGLVIELPEIEPPTQQAVTRLWD